MTTGARHRSMRSLAYAAALAALATGCSLPPASPAGTSPLSSMSSATESLGLTVYPAGERQPIGAISGTTLAGDSLDLASLVGSVVVVNAWASWCDPCREELPLLAAAARAADPDRVRFVGLNVNDSAGAAAQLAESAGVPYPSLVDDGARLLARIPGVPPGAIPSTVVLDRQGRVAARVIGTVKPGMLDPVIEQLTAER